MTFAAKPIKHGDVRQLGLNTFCCPTKGIYMYFEPLFCEFRPQKNVCLFCFFLSSHFFETKAKHVFECFLHMWFVPETPTKPLKKEKDFSHLLRNFWRDCGAKCVLIQVEFCFHFIHIILALQSLKKYPGVVLRRDVLTSRYYLQVAVHWPFASRPPAETSSGHRKGAWRGIFLCPRFIGTSANSIRTFPH